MVDFDPNESSDDEMDKKDGGEGSAQEVLKKVKEHLRKNALRGELQIILGDLIKEDVSAIETLRNHAKTIGGIIGSEYQFFEDKRP